MSDALPANILEAIDDPRWWYRWFDKGDWAAWRAFLCAVFGLPMTEAQAEVFRNCTGRTSLPEAPAREA